MRILLACALACLGCAAFAATVEIPASKDTTLYSENTNFSNGAGEHLFAGRPGIGTFRRALIAFDIAGAVPAGSTITSASLDLYCSKRAPGSPAQNVSLNRLLQSWGESTSDAEAEEGMGTFAANGDATWTTRFVGQLSPWSTAGGSFSGLPSATTSVDSPGLFYTWSSSTMRGDVQAWLDNPAANFGWALIGGEGSAMTARRFSSRQNSVEVFHPVLTVAFDPPAVDTGAVPDGDDVPGTPLLLAKNESGELLLTWSPSCIGDDDYAVYEGNIPAFDVRSAVTCSTSGATAAAVTPAAGATYYLVVPQAAETAEGSYGRNSESTERAPAEGSCLPQMLAAPVCGD